MLTRTSRPWMRVQGRAVSEGECPLQMYRIRPCHKMIPLPVKIRTHAMSSCGPGAALSTLVTVFDPILHKKLLTIACAMRARDFLEL